MLANLLDATDGRVQDMPGTLWSNKQAFREDSYVGWRQAQHLIRRFEEAVALHEQMPEEFGDAHDLPPVSVENEHFPLGHALGIRIVFWCANLIS